MPTIAQSVDNADLNNLASLFQKIRLGQILQLISPQTRRDENFNTAPANPYILATLQGIRRGDVPAAFILRATAKAGGVTGELTVKLFGVTPATGEIAVAPNGDIVTLAADAITALDLVYVPDVGDVVELTWSIPSTGVLDLTTLMPNRKAVALLEAELLTGSVTGKKIVLVPSNSNPATTKANLNLAKTQVLLTAADVGASGGTVRVKLLLKASTDAAALLASSTPF